MNEMYTQREVAEKLNLDNAGHVIILAIKLGIPVKVGIHSELRFNKEETLDILRLHITEEQERLDNLMERIEKLMLLELEFIS